MRDALLTLLYPDACAACDVLLPEGPGMCVTCAESLYPLGAACPICAEPAADGDGRRPCGRCRAAPPPFERTHAPFRYGGELATALRRLKYGGARRAGRLDLARPLGALLAPAFAEALARSGASLVVPVPLHPRRLLVRGFSQAEALAQAALGPRPTVRLEGLVLLRTRHTREQAGLGLSERRANVEGAFTATPRVAGLDVLLVDDVVTTGATARAAAAALRQAGARRVDVVALARAEG